MLATSKLGNLGLNWYPRKKSTTEKSVFGAKFAAMMVGVDTPHII